MPDTLPRSYVTRYNRFGPVRVELHDEKPDRYGRYRYTMFWLADYHPGHPDGEHAIRERAQEFFAVPPAQGEENDDGQA